MADTRLLHSFLHPDRDRNLAANNPYEIRVCNDLISRAFQVRGEVYRDRGEYHQALASYAAAFELGSDDDAMTEAKRDLHRAINLFFNPRLAEREPWPGDGYARQLAEKMTVPDGYHVVGGGNILASYPSTEVGLQAAVEEADLLAYDDGLRRELFLRFLIDEDEFAPAVYRCEGRLAREVHRVSATAASED